MGCRIESERSTGKAPLTDGDVRELLAAADRVLIARGRSCREEAPLNVDLSDFKGPTGKYRAPMLLVGGTLIVGFAAGELDALLAP